MNYKKELGQALQEIKASDWFKELPPEDQEYCLDSQKAIYTPPSDMENTLMNMQIDARGLNDEWDKHRESKYPWADNTTKGEVGIAKRRFITQHITGMAT